MRRITASLLLLLMPFSACTKTVLLPQPIAPQLVQGEIIAVIMKDGQRVETGRFTGVQFASDSSLVLTRRVAGGIDTDTIAVADVESLLVRRYDAGRTGRAVLVPVAVIGLLVAALAASSCPFVYVDDGEAYRLVAEPLGGAVSRGLQRTDLAQLEGLQVVDGEYRLLLINELDETQHLDQLSLVLVTHRQGELPVTDRNATIHVVTGLHPPLAATLGSGEDLLPLVREADANRWTSSADPAVLAADGRTRDTLLLRFARPATDSARLVAGAAVSPWGAHMLKRMLDLWGGDVDEWYRMLDQSAASRALHESWLLREELWLLKVWVEEVGGWRAQDVIIGGGPYVSELQAVALDLSRVEGAEVRIRLDAPRGYWAFDSFALAVDAGRPVQLRELTARTALHRGQADVSRTLAAADGDHVIMEAVGERIDVRFPAPAPSEAEVVTGFLRASGFYRVHTDRTAPRLQAQLDSLWFSPGFGVRLAAAEYGRWLAQRPGNGGAKPATGIR